MLTSTALVSYQPRIKAMADIFVDQLRNAAGEPRDATAWSMFFSFDVMGEVGFGKSFGNLSSGVENRATQIIHGHVKLLGALSTVPWLLNIFASLPGAASTFHEFFDFCYSTLKKKEEVSFAIVGSLVVTNDYLTVKTDMG
jgi:hypothetical protein